MTDKTLVLCPDDEGQPVLLGFYPFGHAQDYFLTGKHSFGREGGSNETDIIVPSYVISRQHGEFGVVENQCFYRDLGSSNGTWINGSLCEGSCCLKDGDILSFFARRGGQLRPEYKMVFTRSREDCFDWRKIPLTGDVQEIVVGRGEGSFRVEDAFISEKHASFFCGSKGFSVLDFESTNGVFVNNKRISGCALLAPMDIIRIGNTWFFYQEQCLWMGTEKAKSRETASGKNLVIDIREKSVLVPLKKENTA